MAGADLRAAFVASCFRGALPPVDLRAVCFVRAIVKDCRAAKIKASATGEVSRHQELEPSAVSAVKTDSPSASRNRQHVATTC